MTDESTKDRILQAAGPIFASKGFRKTTVREISDAANVNLASMNYYFGDKKNLYLETVVAARASRAQQHPLPEWTEATTAEEKLLDFITMLLNRLVAMQSEPWPVRLLMRETLQPTEACQHLVEDYFKPMFGQLLSIVDELTNKELSDDERTKIGFSILGQCLYYRFASELTQIYLGESNYQENFSKASLARHIHTFSLAAIQNVNSFKETALGIAPAPHIHTDTNKTNQA